MVEQNSSANDSIRYIGVQTNTANRVVGVNKLSDMIGRKPFYQSLNKTNADILARDTGLGKMAQQLSIVSFEDSQKFEKATKKDYRYRTDYFYANSEIKSDEMLLNYPTEALQQELTIFTKFLNQRVEAKELSPNSVPKFFKGLKWLLNANGRENEIKWKQIESLFPKEVKKTGYKAYTNEQVEQMVQFASSLKDKAVIHFVASLGGRIGVHDHELILDHLIPMEWNGHKCYAVLVYAEDMTAEEKDERDSSNYKDDVQSGDSYWAFLTPEATQFLDEYFESRKTKGENLHGDRPVFLNEAHNSKSQQMRGMGIERTIQRALRNAKIVRKKKEGQRRYDIQITHGFRKRFNTILKLDDSNVNSNIAEKILGHRNGLDGVYLAPTRQECFKEFCKAIPQLTIDSSLRKQQQITTIQDEKDRIIEKLTNENKNMIQEIQRINNAVPYLKQLIAAIDLTHDKSITENEFKTKKKEIMSEVSTELENFSDKRDD